MGKNSKISPKVSTQTWPTFLIFPIPFLLDFVDYYYNCSLYSNSVHCHYSFSNIDKQRPLTLLCLTQIDREF